VTSPWAAISSSSTSGHGSKRQSSPVSVDAGDLLNPGTVMRAAVRNLCG
jgi:hypothetical protein